MKDDTESGIIFTEIDKNLKRIKFGTDSFDDYGCVYTYINTLKYSIIFDSEKETYRLTEIIKTPKRQTPNEQTNESKTSRLNVP